MSTPDDGTMTYDYTACNTVYDELLTDQATIAAQMEVLEQTISALYPTWTGISADTWQATQKQWNAEIAQMHADLQNAAKYLAEMAANMQYTDRSAAYRIASIGR